MRLSYIAFFLFLFTFGFTAQSQNTDEIEVGDVLKIGASENYQYSHINFPKANFIIKSGGLANFKELEGTLVQVTAVETKPEKTIIAFRRKDGNKFFGSFPEVKANYNKAITSNELIK